MRPHVHIGDPAGVPAPYTSASGTPLVYLPQCTSAWKAVEVLARALVGDGHRIRNPFAAFGAPSPSAVSRLPFADEARAVHRLVGAIRRDVRASERTSRAGQAAEDAARAVEQAIVRVQKAEASARSARVTRDVIGRSWHSAFTALKHEALEAGDEGAPEMHAMLFAAPTRAASKGKRRAAPARTATD